jgi:hypothetical protein
VGVLSIPGYLVRLRHEPAADGALGETTSMRYVCLVYYDEAAVEALPASACGSLAEEVLAYREELRGSECFIAAAILQPACTATTIRVRDGRVSVTAGPFAETREQLAGVYMIEARDLNDAIRVASQIPPARLGRIEVRPLRELMVRSSWQTPGPEKNWAG